MPDFGHGVPGPENEGFMTILTRLERWKAQGTISPEQHAYLSGLSRGEPFSLFLELNVLLYAGVLAFVAGLGWTVTTWSQQLGDVLVLTILSTILAACFWYCFSRSPASFSSSLIVSTIASCCRSLCRHSADGSGSPSRTGRPIRTRRIANMPFSTACWSASAEQFSSASV